MAWVWISAGHVLLRLFAGSNAWTALRLPYTTLGTLRAKVRSFITATHLDYRAFHLRASATAYFASFRALHLCDFLRLAVPPRLRNPEPCEKAAKSVRNSIPANKDRGSSQAFISHIFPGITPHRYIRLSSYPANRNGTLQSRRIAPRSRSPAPQSRPSSRGIPLPA